MALLWSIVPMTGKAQTDSVAQVVMPDSIKEETIVQADSLGLLTGKKVSPKRDWTTWKPQPKRAM